MSSSSIPAAVDRAVVVRPPLPVKTTWPRRLVNFVRPVYPMPAQPAIDEGVVAEAIREDARRAARALDENSLPHPQSPEMIVLYVLGLVSILGTQAVHALGRVEQQFAPMVAEARTAKAHSPVLTALFWTVLLVIETIAVRVPLADMLELSTQLEKWVAAASIAVLTNVAGIALSRAWFHSLSPSDDEPDGMVGRHILRASRVAVGVTMLMFVGGLVWGRVLYAADVDAGLDAVTVNAQPAHALMISGLVLMAASVSFAIKTTALTTDSRTILRLDVGLQRFRTKSVQTLAAHLQVITAYITLEHRARQIAMGAPQVWLEAFLEALPANTRDRWIEYLETHPMPESVMPDEAAWVHKVRTRIAEQVAQCRRGALPSMVGTVDLLDVVDVREDEHRP